MILLIRHVYQSADPTHYGTPPHSATPVKHVDPTHSSTTPPLASSPSHYAPPPSNVAHNVPLGELKFTCATTCIVAIDTSFLIVAVDCIVASANTCNPSVAPDSSY